MNHSGLYFHQTYSCGLKKPLDWIHRLSKWIQYGPNDDCFFQDLEVGKFNKWTWKLHSPPKILEKSMENIWKKCHVSFMFLYKPVCCSTELFAMRRPRLQCGSQPESMQEKQSSCGKAVEAPGSPWEFGDIRS